MKTNLYLYGVSDLSHLIYMSYIEAIQIKIDLGKMLLTKLVRVDDMRDDKRIKAVQDAIEFNKKMLILKDR